MNTGRIQRQALEYRLGGKRPMGRPTYSWEKVKTNVEKIGIAYMDENGGRGDVE